MGRHKTKPKPQPPTESHNSPQRQEVDNHSKKLKSGKSMGDLKDKLLQMPHHEPDMESLRQRSIREARIRKEILSNSRMKDKQVTILKNQVEKYEVDRSVLRSRLQGVRGERDAHLEKAKRLFYELRECKQRLEMEANRRYELELLLKEGGSRLSSTTGWGKKGKRSLGEEDEYGHFAEPPKKPNKEVARLKEELSKNYNEIIKVELAMKSMNADNEALKVELKGSRDANEELRAVITDLRVQIGRLKDEKESDIARLRMSEKQREDILSKLKQSEESTSEATVLKQQRQALESQLAEMVKKVQQLECLGSQESHKSEELEKELAKLKKANKELKDKEKQLDQQIAAMKMDRESEKRSLKETIKELQGRADGAVSRPDVDKEIAEARKGHEKEIAEVRKAIDRERDKIKDEKEQMRREIARIVKESEDN